MKISPAARRIRRARESVAKSVNALREFILAYDNGCIPEQIAAAYDQAVEAMDAYNASQVEIGNAVDNQICTCCQKRLADCRCTLEDLSQEQPTDDN